MKVSAVSATIADSDIDMAATEYSTSPSEAATSTMQRATKIVEIRITREGPQASRSRDRSTLALLLIRQARGLLRTPVLTGSPGERSETRGHHSPDFAALIRATERATPPRGSPSQPFLRSR